jgi:hypothetical protein
MSSRNFFFKNIPIEIEPLQDDVASEDPKKISDSKVPQNPAFCGVQQRII